jgi:hypothetical protein
VKSHTLVRIISLLRSREAELGQWVRLPHNENYQRIEIATLRAMREELGNIAQALENEFSDDEREIIDENKNPSTKGEKLAARGSDLNATETG